MRSVGARRGRLNLALDKDARHEKPIGFDIPSKASAKKPVSQVHLKPIGFECESNNHSQKQRNLSCVGFGQKSGVSTHTKPGRVHTPFAPPAAPVKLVDRRVISTTRERDEDHEAGQ